jgi:hypothetical protein
MKFLFDTNIIISAEPTTSADIEAHTANVSILFGLIKQMDAAGYVHPASFDEIRKDKDEKRRTTRQKLLSKYLRLEAPPPITQEIISILGKPKPNSHNAVDMLLLAALVGNAVDFLVTNDNGIHRRSARLDLAERVLTADEALLTVRGLLPKLVQTPPAVEQVKCYQLQKTDLIFNSLRKDYPEFDIWLEKCQREHRPAFLIKDGSQYAAVAIIKEEAVSDDGLSGTALKICTFKVAETANGFRYGELLLKAIFGYIHAKGISQGYLTCYPKQASLIRFLERFGFFEQSQTDNGELVFVKRFIPPEHDRLRLSPLEFHRQYGPYQMNVAGVEKFVIPIQPKYHKILFPDLEEQLNLFAGSNACGNSILKAYLCNAIVKDLPPGSIILFYRSQDKQHIQSVGVVEKCLRSSNAAEIAQFVGKRTVYSLKEIEKMCSKETLAILFRYAKGIPSVSLTELIDNKALTAAPQQIMRVKQDARQWIQSKIEL